MPLYNPISGANIVAGTVTSADITDGTIAPADESAQALSAHNLYLAANYQ